MKTSVHPAISAAYSAILESDVFRLSGPAIDLPEALLSLAVAVRDHETDESTWGLGEHTEVPLGDLIVAAYWTLSEWHAGQSSVEYQALSTMGQIYSPGCTNGPEPESCEAIAAEMLAAWFEAKHGDPAAFVSSLNAKLPRGYFAELRQGGARIGVFYPSSAGWPRDVAEVMRAAGLSGPYSSLSGPCLEFATPPAR